jgi:hypothetical protein
MGGEKVRVNASENLRRVNTSLHLSTQADIISEENKAKKFAVDTSFSTPFQTDGAGPCARKDIKVAVSLTILHASITATEPNQIVQPVTSPVVQSMTILSFGCR